jgi:hypothetical protein
MSTPAGPDRRASVEHGAEDEPWTGNFDRPRVRAFTSQLGRRGLMADAAAIVRSVYEAFGKGDLDGVLSVMADDIEWFEAEHNPYWPGHAMVGPEAIVRADQARACSGPG